MKRSLMTAVAAAAMMSVASLAHAQGNPAPPLDPASPRAQPATSHNLDPTLPFQGPAATPNNPQLAANTGCEPGGNKDTPPPRQNGAAGTGRTGNRLPATPTFCP